MIFILRFFKLLLHEVMLRFGSSVAPDPVLSGTKRQPDFLVQDPGFGSYILEAATVRDETPAERTARGINALLFDELNKMQLPDYFLRIRDGRNPALRQPSARAVREFIQTQLRNVWYSDVPAAAMANRIDQLPVWTYKDAELEIDIGIIPVSEEHRGSVGHRALGTYPVETKWGGSVSAIGKSIRKKASRYGDTGYPYVIATNVLSRWGMDPGDVLTALFGPVVVHLDPRNGSHRSFRRPGGVWYSRAGPTNRRVSAVVVTWVVPWNLATAAVWVFHNPWAHRPYTGFLDQFPSVRLVSGRFQRATGTSLAQTLALPPSWPGKLFDDCSASEFSGQFDVN